MGALPAPQLGKFWSKLRPRSTKRTACGASRSRSHRPSALHGLTHPVPLLPLPRTHPEGAQPGGRFCRVCDSRWKCLQASWPGGKGWISTVKGTGQNHPVPLGRPGPASPKDARHSPCAPALHSSSLSTGPPKLFLGSPPNNRRRPETPRALVATPTHLSDTPCRVLSAPHRLLAFAGSQTQTTRNCFARSLPTPAQSLKQKRREGGGGRGGGRKV